MYENTNLRCRNCKFWWPIADQQVDLHLRMHATRGQCRRHAPPPASVEAIWPNVRNEDWCGEHVHISA
jgi:hypothetical protein